MQDSTFDLALFTQDQPRDSIDNSIALLKVFQDGFNEQEQHPQWLFLSVIIDSLSAVNLRLKA